MSNNITDKFAVKYAYPIASADKHQKIMTKDMFPPTCYCNYKKQEDMNRKIYQRNIPQQVKKIVPELKEINRNFTVVFFLIGNRIRSTILIRDFFNLKTRIVRF